MSVNLKAVATLNGKPYLDTLSKLEKATGKLNTRTIKGGSQVEDNLKSQIAAREAASKLTEKELRTQTVASSRNARSAQQLNTLTKEQIKNNKALQKSLNDARVAAYAANAERMDGMRKVTAAEQARIRATESYRRSVEAVAQARATGLTGPAMDTLDTKSRNAADQLAAAERRVANERIATKNKVAAAEAKAVAAQEAAEAKAQRIADKENARNEKRLAQDTARAAAMQRGQAESAKYIGSLAGLDAAQLKSAAAAERLTAAQSRLAAALASGNQGAISSARSGVINATAAMHKLEEAQKAVAKSGPQAASGLAAQRHLFSDISRQAAGASLALAAVPAAAVIAGAVWENQFANVVRTADPALAKSPMRVEALKSSLIDMAKTMPMAFGNITEIATLGNQMGVAASELDGFTRSVAMFSATSGVAVDTAATAFGRLRTVASDANFSYMGIADSILNVGVNSVATEEEIINVTTQISSIAGAAGYSSKEMIGLSGALASVRVPPELSRSIITRTFGQFDKAVQKNGTELQTLARLSGYSVEQIKEQWGTEGAADIFTGFISGLGKAGSAARDELAALGLTSVRDVPSLMRLANAADSNGVKGGLLSQTMGDAETGQGEVQRQYSIMAETVIGRLKVLGNTVVSFFNTLGESSNGFVKGAIDGLTNLFNWLDKMADNPFSSWALGAMAALAGFTALLSVGTKLTSTMKMMQHASQVTGLTGFASAIGMSKKGGGVGQLAEMSPMLLGLTGVMKSMGQGAKIAGTNWKNFGNVISSTGSWIVAERHIKNTGLGFRTLGDSIQAGTKQVPAATSALSRFTAVALNPLTLGLAAVGTVGAIAYTQWADGFYKATTSSTGLAESLAEVNPKNLGEISNALKAINVDGRDLWRLGTSSVQPFSEGLPGLAKDLTMLNEYTAAMEEIDGMKSRHKKTLRRTVEQDMINQGLDGKAVGAGLGVLDGAMKELRAAGNDSQVRSLWTQMGSEAKTASERAEIMKAALEYMPEEAAALTREFALQDMTLEEGLLKFSSYSREMRDVAAQFDGTSVIADAFGLDDEAAKAFGTVMNDAAAAFIDFNAALEAGTVTNEDGEFASFDLGKWKTSLSEANTAQEDWMNNIRQLSRLDGFSSDMLQAMGEMGPAGKHLAQSLVDGINADGTLTQGAAEALQVFQDSVNRSKIDFGPQLAEYNNVLDQSKAAFGDRELSLEFQASLTPDSWSTLSTGLNSIIDKHGGEAGRKLQAKLLSGLESGQISMDQFSSLTAIMGQIGYNASNALIDGLNNGATWEQIEKRIERISEPKITVDLEANDGAVERVESSFKALLGNKGVEVPANFSLKTTTMGDLRTLMNQPGLLPDIEAGVTLDTIIAEGQLNGFRSWAIANGIDIEVEAHPNAAYMRVSELKQFVQADKLTATIDAIATPAENTFYSFVQANDGRVIAVEVNATTGQATNVVQALDAQAGETVWKPLELSDDAAQAAVDEINAKAEAAHTKNITVTDNGTADAVQTAINNIKGRTVTVTVVRKESSANGNIFEAYANGGIREDHRPQILAAGTNRLWAEPETGGEAYIPFSKTKRKRAESILNEVANRFGKAVVPYSQANFADGGYYNAQSQARMLRPIAQPAMMSEQSGPQWNMTIVNPVVRDPFEDAWHHIETKGGF